MVEALPKGRKELKKLIKLCPREAEELLPGEMWVLGGTGSTKHGLNVKKEIPAIHSLSGPCLKRSQEQQQRQQVAIKFSLVVRLT